MAGLGAATGTWGAEGLEPGTAIGALGATAGAAEGIGALESGAGIGALGAIGLGAGGMGALGATGAIPAIGMGARKGAPAGG